MRVLFPPVWEGLVTALQDIFVGGFPADKVIQRQLKMNKKWGSSDRRVFAEAVYDVVRWWRRLLVAAGREFKSEWSAANRDTFAAAAEAWALLNQVELKKGIALTGLSAASVERAWNDRSLPRAVRESVPDWLDAWGFEQLGPRWDELLPALNSVAPVYLRANRLKTTPEKLVHALKQEKIEAQVEEADCVRLIKRANVFLTRAFKAGLFEVQDMHSQRVAPLVGAQPGERVIDACAGAGGKSLHLAALMGNKGKVIAMDVGEKKLEALRERSTRAGATCIETRLIDTTKVFKRLADSGDRVLLDVPCSGLGVLRRNPDSKWKLSPDEIARVCGLQTEILASYSAMTKPGGTLVYATCSIAPSENLRQVENFLSQNETFALEEQHTLWPQANGADGFFMAKLKRLS